MQTVPLPNKIFKPDPLLGWRLSPGGLIEMAFRPAVAQTVNADGWRHVPDSPVKAASNLAIYGCSFTFGTGLSDEETYPAQLQSAFPRIRILNRGIGGHGSVQNYLQFRRDVKHGLVDAAVFGIISDHRFRNVPHPQRMRQFLNRHWYEKGVDRVPTARMTRNGELQIEYVPIWQPVLLDNNIEVFLPDVYMVDQATLLVLRSICEFAKQRGIPVSLAILDQLDTEFNQLLMNSIPEVMDVSTPYDQEHTFIPHDLHPNPRANYLFAQRLIPTVQELIGRSDS